MKAEKIMIGDYFSVKPSGMPIKVAAVHHKKVAYHAVVNKLAWVRESLLEPIPLTPEILGKNGFVYKEDDRILTGGFYQFVGEGKREGYSILIKFYDGTIGDIKVLVKIHTESSYGIGVNEIHSCDIEYVHELQHALRLCKIKKEIEL